MRWAAAWQLQVHAEAGAAREAVWATLRGWARERRSRRDLWGVSGREGSRMVASRRGCRWIHRATPRAALRAGRPSAKVDRVRYSIAASRLASSASTRLEGT